MGLSAARNDLPAYKGIESGFAAEFQSFFLIRFRNEKHHADTHVEDTELLGISMLPSSTISLKDGGGS